MSSFDFENIYFGEVFKLWITI